MQATAQLRTARSESWWQKTSSFLEQHTGVVGVLLLCLYLLSSLGEARNKIIWYDELVTVETASLPNDHAIIHFFSSGKDTTSATCALIDHLALKLPIDPEISARLPFIFAFGLMFVFLYLFMRRRYPPMYALATPLLLFGVTRASESSVEARGYALLMMGTALAMYCWEIATSKTQRRFASLLGLWFGLAFAINAHTFGVLLIIPFGLAELWRDYRNRRVDWPVWVALVCFPLGLLPVIRGQMLANKYYGANFWAQPHLRDLLEFLKSKGFVAVVVASLLFLLLRKSRTPTGEQPGEAGGFTPPEWLLCTVLAVLPLYTVPLSYLIHVYRSLYVMEYRIGCAAVVVALIAWLAHRSRQAGLALVLVLFLYTAARDHRAVGGGVEVLMHPREVHSRLVQRFNSLAWVRLLQQSDLPVVVSEQVTYATLRSYAEPELRQRLLILTDLRDLPMQPDSETGQKNLMVFGPAFGWRVMDVRQYLPAHPDFLLVGNQTVPGDWITGRLQKLAPGEATLRRLGGGAEPYPGATVWAAQVAPAGVAAMTQ